MDGTLLNDEKKISDRTVKAVKAAVEKGVKFVITTGRLFTSANYYAEFLGIKVPIISANGAYIREKDKNEVIYKSVLGAGNSREILAILRKYNICPNFHTTDTIFTDSVNRSVDLYVKFNKFTTENNRINIEVVKEWDEVFSKNEDNILKCIAIDDNLENVRAAKEEMLKLPDIEVVSSYYNNFEVMGKGTSKGRAVEILAGYYNISREEIICIGDNENDLSMIEYAGLGVAMGNSEEDVLKAADYVTDTNNNDGVAKVIEKFIL